MKISLIVPCYNEEANLQKGVLDKIGNFTKEDSRFVEVLIVDDGSVDNSKKIIKSEYLTQFPKFRLIENKHQGKATAVITGIKESKGDYVLFSDIDLATPIEEADKLIEGAAEGFTIVIGSRKAQRKGAPLLRKVLSMGGVVVRHILIGITDVNDTQCGFKLFRKKEALEIIKHLKVFHDSRLVKGSTVSAGFDVEFLFLAGRLKYKIKEVPVHWRHVETKNVHFLKDSFESLRDYTKIKYYDLIGRYRI